MKNQKWGCFAYPSRTLVRHCLTSLIGSGCAKKDLESSAKHDYEEKRSNGKWYDGGASMAIPADGSLVWVKGRVKGRNVDGVKESDGYYHYEVRYDEGPGDKAWMEERDWKYIQRLVDPSYGLCLLVNEPNADKEIAADHKYRVEITRALRDARAAKESAEKREVRPRATAAAPPSSYFWAPASSPRILPPAETAVPPQYICSITDDIMREPVMDREGHTFERAAIEEWVETNHTCPISREPLELADLAPNRSLRELIEGFLTTNPALRSGAPAPAP